MPAAVVSCRPTPAWPDIYARLRRDANDSAAIAALEAGVAPWARKHLRHPALRTHREDVVAETCSAAVLGIATAYGPETFSSFVYGHYLNARRRAHQRARLTLVPLDEADLPVLAADQHPPDAPAPDELLLLEHWLAALPTRERRAVELRYLDGATTRQIAEALDVTEVNARRIVFNGLGRLRQQAGRLWPRGRS